MTHEYLYPRIAHQSRAYRLYPDDMRLAAALCSAVTGEQCVTVEEFFLPFAFPHCGGADDAAPYISWCSSMEERLRRKQRVEGSNPFASSI